MKRPNQNRLLRVQDGLRIHFDSVCDELADIEEEIGSYTAYADLGRSQSALSFAQLSYASLEHTAESVPPRHLNAFSFGHVVAQLCTRYDGEILLSNQHDDDEQPAPNDFRTILDTYFARSAEVHGLTSGFLDIADETHALHATKPTEYYMAGAAMLLADLSNMKLNEIDRLSSSYDR